jgi:hypothetical protein
MRKGMRGVVHERGKVVAVLGELKLGAVHCEDAPAVETPEHVLGKNNLNAGGEKRRESGRKYVEARLGKGLLAHRLLNQGIKKLHETVYFKLKGLAGKIHDNTHDFRETHEAVAGEISRRGTGSFDKPIRKKMLVGIDDKGHCIFSHSSIYIFYKKKNELFK